MCGFLAHPQPVFIDYIYKFQTATCINAVINLTKTRLKIFDQGKDKNPHECVRKRARHFACVCVRLASPQ